jgi:hypothetical protein
MARVSEKSTPTSLRPAAATARPLYVVFLERVIHIKRVQRHRKAVRDEQAGQFSAGCIPGRDFRWPLDEWLAGQREDLSAYGGPPAWSPELQAAWDDVRPGWKGFVAELRSGALAVTGRHPESGIRATVDPSEFSRAELWLDVRNGDLYDYSRRPAIESVPIDRLWASLVVCESLPAGEPAQAPNSTPLQEPKEWFEAARKAHPRHKKECVGDYGGRLHGYMQIAPVTKVWSLATLLRRFYDKK